MKKVLIALLFLFPSSLYAHTDDIQLKMIQQILAILSSINERVEQLESVEPRQETLRETPKEEFANPSTPFETPKSNRHFKPPASP